jgi:hypothetical protein
MSIKMAWLILGTEKYGGTSQIDVAPDVYVKVSDIHMTWLFYKSRQIDWGDSKWLEIRNKFQTNSFLIFLKDQNKKIPVLLPES